MMATQRHKISLAVLVSALEDARPSLTLDGDVTGIAIDSRDVRRGSVFVALRGTAVDGHQFVGQAQERGAAAVVVDHHIDNVAVPMVVVGDTTKALAELASRFYGDPASNLVLCGITGTNGKTTTAHMIRAIVGASRLGKMGIVGTLGHGVEQLQSTVHTTPDAVTLHALFGEMVEQECFGVVMEVSSHAVRQHRTWGLEFSVGILTNVTHDHLDFHNDIEDYRGAKAAFCESLLLPERRKPRGTLVYSSDDTVAHAIGERFAGAAVPVGADGLVRVSDVDATLSHTSLTLTLQEGSVISLRMRLLGAFVASNAALAAAAAIELGADAAAVKSGLESISRIPGRFEALGGGDRPVVIIDYSHTADAMERVLGACRALCPECVTTVFGCGGDRDRKKRPLMAAVAERLSDAVVVTTDNPRNEQLQQIVDDILSGANAPDAITVNLDRANAVQQAIHAAAPGDVVLLLGKGHEDYQIIGDERHPYSDRVEAEGALRSWSAR